MVSNKIGFKAVWPHDGHADSVGINPIFAVKSKIIFISGAGKLSLEAFIYFGIIFLAVPNSFSSNIPVQMKKECFWKYTDLFLP